MASPNHILLVGFMGSGKSSVARRLSSITGLSLIDLDYRIEVLEHRKIKQIFAAEGEPGFRAIETRILKGLAREDRSIVSCGGGIIGSAENRETLHQLGTVVYLQVSFEGALARISNSNNRPMLQGEIPPRELYEGRLALYEEVADITVDTTGRTVYQAASLTLAALKKEGIL